ncbi:hypothetical protein AB4156_45185, partial [Cupriavidus sp. 2MCAB6]|uniref:hypothetical protein n=1 Tax=Cupriavidus sp. 2MCAB6 TaxID=3232981 RepID=UPI003F919171
MYRRRSWRFAQLKEHRKTNSTEAKAIQALAQQRDDSAPALSGYVTAYPPTYRQVTKARVEPEEVVHGAGFLRYFENYLIQKSEIAYRILVYRQNIGLGARVHK